MTEGPEVTTNPSADGTPWRRKLALALLGLITLTSYHSVFPVFAMRIRDYFRMTAEQYGTLMGFMSIGRIPSLVGVGPLIARIGVRRVTQFALVGVGASFLLVGVGSNLLSFQLGLLAMGLFGALAGVGAPAFFFALYPALKRRLFSVLLVATAGPGILFPLLANKMLKWSARGGNQAFVTVLYVPFIFVGSVLFIGGTLLGIGRKAQVQVSLETTSTIHLRQLYSLHSLVIVLLIALHGAADNTLYLFLPMFMETYFARLPIAPAWAVAGHGLAYVITRSVLSVLPEGFAQRSILTLAGPLGGLLVIATLWWGQAVSLPILYTVACLFFAAEYPALISEISSRSMGHFGSVLATGFLVSELTTFALLKGTGRLMDRTGDYRLALSIAACGFVAFGLIAAFSGLGKSASTKKR